MSRLILWRHGQTAWNVGTRVQGHADVDLDDTGLAQAQDAAALLAAERPDRIVSSDLRRAYDTARALAAVTGLPIHSDERLRERGYGDWQGLTHADIAERYPESWRAWTSGEPVGGRHGIERHEDMHARVGAVLTEVTAGFDGTVVVVTHGGTARHALAVLCGVPEFADRLEGLHNCHWSELRLRRTGWRVHAHNVGVREAAGRG